MVPSHRLAAGNIGRLTSAKIEPERTSFALIRVHSRHKWTLRHFDHRKSLCDRQPKEDRNLLCFFGASARFNALFRNLR